MVKDTRVAKPGDQISQKLASLLSKLDIKPIEAGISVVVLLQMVCSLLNRIKN